MRVGMFADPLGFGDRKNVVRYREMQDWLSACLPGVTFNVDHDFDPFRLLRFAPDLYLLDLYSLKIESDMIQTRLGRLLEAALTYPSSLFIVWSAFTAQRLLLHQRYSVAVRPNIVLRCPDFFEKPDSSFDRKVKEWAVAHAV